MRYEREQRLRKRREQLARDFIDDIAARRAEYRFPRRRSTADNVALYLAADHLAVDYGLSTDGRILDKIAGWLRGREVKFEDVEQLLTRVRIFSAQGVSISSDGRVHSGEPEKIEQLRDFIRPDHIYLDVTLATREDVAAVWGDPAQIDIIRKEVKRRIPKAAKERATRLFRDLYKWEGGRQSATRMLEKINAKPPRNGKRYTIKELEKYFTAHLHQRLKEDPTFMWTPRVSDPPTVSELQDYWDIVLHDAEPEKVKPLSRRGRAKGYATGWSRWRELAGKIGWRAARQIYLAELREQFLKSGELFSKWEKSEEYRRAKNNWRTRMPHAKLTRR